MANGKITNYYVRSSATVTSGAGTSIAVVFYKVGRVCSMIIGNGSFTVNVNDELFAVPEGFEPMDVVDFSDSFANKRIIVNNNRKVTCGENLTSQPIRGSVTYISAS